MVSLQLRLCLTFLPASASLRLRDLGRRLCLLFDLCLCPLVAEKATGFGVVLPRVFFWSSSVLGVFGSGLAWWSYGCSGWFTTEGGRKRLVEVVTVVHGLKVQRCFSTAAPS